MGLSKGNCLAPTLSDIVSTLNFNESYWNKFNCRPFVFFSDPENFSAVLSHGAEQIVKYTTIVLAKLALFICPFFQFNVDWCCKVFRICICESEPEFTTYINFLVSEFWFVPRPDVRSEPYSQSQHALSQQAKQKQIHAVLVCE